MKRFVRGFTVFAAGALILTSACSEPTDYDDSIYPDPGNSGTIVLSEVTDTSLTLSWGPALDEQSSQEMLEYRAVHSTSDDVGTVQAIANVSSPLLDWAADSTNVQVTGLEPDSTYYFNVAVRDQDGNMSAYVMNERPLQVQDTLAPTAGSSGSIMPTEVHKTDVVLEWEPATDNATASGDLRYKVVHSMSSNIGTVTDAQNNGMLVQDWSKDYTGWTASGLTQGTTYYFNVLVQDEAGNMSAYSMLDTETLQPFIYFSDQNEGEIERINRDLSGRQIVASSTNVNTGVPYGFDFEKTIGKLYYTDFTADRIVRTNPDGSYPEILLDSGDGVLSPTDVAVDSDRGIIYWLNRGDNTIRRTWVDAPGNETVMSGLPSGLLSIALDESQQMVYWTDYSGNTVERMNYDGTGRDTVLSAGADGIDAPIGISLDTENGKLYFADRGNDLIRRANLDGSGLEDVITGVSSSFFDGVDYNPATNVLYYVDNDSGGVYVARVELTSLPIAVSDASVEVIADTDMTTPGLIQIVDF